MGAPCPIQINPEWRGKRAAHHRHARTKHPRRAGWHRAHLPPPATVPKHILKSWATRVEEAAGGKLKIEHYDAMSLGGRPPDLMDQAVDRVADIIMTVVGYTPGRFPKTEVFELPFMMTDPAATSMAFQDLVETDLQNGEYSNVKVLGAWPRRNPHKGRRDQAGGSGRQEIARPDPRDFRYAGRIGRNPGGHAPARHPRSPVQRRDRRHRDPVGITPAIKLSELVGNHTEFGGKEALYTATIIMVMNKAKYDSLPDDIRAAIDTESGQKLAQFAAQVMYDYDKPGRDIAEKAGNTIVTLDEAEVARWKAKATPVIDRWVKDMDAKDIDGMALIEQAKGLIKKHGG